MKISASIYSDSSQNLVATIKELEAHHIDMLHVDCIEKPSVFDDIQKARELSKLPIDLHLITETPSAFEGLLKKTPVDFLTIQFENLKGSEKLPKEVKKRNNNNKIRIKNVFNHFSGKTKLTNAVQKPTSQNPNN